MASVSSSPVKSELIASCEILASLSVCSRQFKRALAFSGRNLVARDRLYMDGRRLPSTGNVKIDVIVPLSKT